MNVSNPPRIKQEEYTPPVIDATIQNIPVYGGFWFTDVGVSSSHSIILNKEKGIVIDFFEGSDSNQLDFGPQVVKDLANKFDKDLSIMIRSLRFRE